MSLARKLRVGRPAVANRIAGTVLLLSVSAFVACFKELTFEPLPVKAIALTPPASYSVWWDQMQTCSGLTGKFADVHWYQVPKVDTFASTNGLPVYGLWILGLNAITIAGNHLNDSLTVRHEELHALLNAHGHPAEYFVTKCASLIGNPRD